MTAKDLREMTPEQITSLFSAEFQRSIDFSLFYNTKTDIYDVYMMALMGNI
jgi:hypothetical protein